MNRQLLQKTLLNLFLSEMRVRKVILNPLFLTESGAAIKETARFAEEAQFTDRAKEFLTLLPCTADALVFLMKWKYPILSTSEDAGGTGAEVFILGTAA